MILKRLFLKIKHVKDIQIVLTMINVIQRMQPPLKRNHSDAELSNGHSGVCEMVIGSDKIYFLTFVRHPNKPFFFVKY